MASETVYEINNDDAQKRKRYIKGLFDSIVPTYDLLNHILSFGTDVRWRKDMVRRIDRNENSQVMDLCCGTGDVSRLLRQCGMKTFSLDFSLEMLQKGTKKKALGGRSIMADACTLPFKSDSMDAATIAFGIRNIPDLDRFMQEVHRVLKPGGQLMILELVRPEKRLVRVVYSFYLGRLLPLIGGILSGKPQAYRYLSGTIATFVHPQTIGEMLQKHGFNSVLHFPKTLGVATVIGCRKEPQ